MGGSKTQSAKGKPLRVIENEISFNSLVEDAHVDKDAQVSMD